jgi:hypothetical protein
MATPARTSVADIRPSTALSSDDFAAGFINEDLRTAPPGAAQQQPDFFACPADGVFTRIWRAGTKMALTVGEMAARQYRRWTGQVTFVDESHGLAATGNWRWRTRSCEVGEASGAHCRRPAGTLGGVVKCHAHISSDARVTAAW